MKEINVSHGGHSGDIIYGLALARQISVNHGCAVNIYISNNRPAVVKDGMQHPNGREVLMTEAAYAFLEPLLSIQPWVNSVRFVPDEAIPHDAVMLDPYRFNHNINTYCGHIADWPAKIFGVSIDIVTPWLVTRPVKVAPTSVTICFTKRYRNTAIDYAFLDHLEYVRFIGIEEEYEHFKAKHGLSGLQYTRCTDALEFAECISSSRIFVGNQSFAFAIAEALKVRRALETCEICPNVIPTGFGAGSFIYSSGLANLLRKYGLAVDDSKVEVRAATFSLYLHD